VHPHEGRGGWSWLTGAASWMYRLIMESLVGFRQEGNRLSFQTLLPADWPQVEITYKYHDTLYEITILQQDKPDDQSEHTAAPQRLFVDGVKQSEAFVLLENDGGTHKVELYLYVHKDVKAFSGLV